MLFAKKITQIKWNSSFLIPLFNFTLLFVTGLWVSRHYSFLLFHSLAELFGILVAFGIFVLAWNARGIIKNNYLLFIGIAYLFVGILDLFHTLAYEGMGVFKGYDANLATQLWIAARYMESLSLLVAPVFIHKKLKASVVFSVYSMALFLIFMSIFQWHIFPGCFVNGLGLTPFKKISEYIISGILAVSIILLWKRREDFDKTVLLFIIISILTTICSDLVLTSYTSIYGSSSFIGHFLKIFSFYLIYKAILETGLRKPFGLLFRDLKKTETALKKARDHLELKVNMRTRELIDANKELRREIIEHRHSREKVFLHQKRLKNLATQLTIVEEKERRRIAEQLHDNIGQTLAFTRIQIETSKKDLADDDLINTLDEISQSLLTAIKDTKELVFDLSSPLLNEIGLSAAISNILESQIHKKHGIEIEFIDTGEKIDISDDVKTILFRNVRELLNNVIKHARATRVKVELQAKNENLKIIVADDGVGFKHDLKEILTHGRIQFGLFSIKAQMGDFNGSLDIISREGSGCQAVLSIPL